MNVETLRSKGDTLSEAAMFVAQRLRRPSLAPLSVGITAFAIDALAVMIGLWLAHLVASAGPLRSGLAAGGVGLLAATLAASCGGYRLTRLRRFWPGWALLAAGAAALAAAISGFGLWSGWSAVLAPAVATVLPRALTARFAGWVLDSGLTDRRAIVVGGGAEVERLIRGLAANPDNDIRVLGIFDDRDDARSPAVLIGTPKLGRVPNAIAFAREAQIDMLIVALPLTAERRIREVLDQVRVLPMDVRLSAFSSDFAFPRGGTAAGLIEVMRRPLDGWRWLAKRAFDLVVAVGMLAALSPVLILTAVAIRAETRGPIFFRQQRHGYNNREVPVWKFRSMHDAASDPSARRLVTRDDPRVTRVGRFIRRWSIDELPQLFNVLRGELSLVGPRPHVVDAVSSTRRAFEEIVESYAARHRVPPGLTGWAQIHGWRGEIDAPEKLEARVAHDLYYIENWSIWLDLYILAMTPIRLLDGRNAY